MMLSIRVARLLHFWSQTLNDALCFSLYLSFLFIVFVTILMTIWLQKCSDLATLLSIQFAVVLFKWSIEYRTMQFIFTCVEKLVMICQKFVVRNFSISITIHCFKRFFCMLNRDFEAIIMMFPLLQRDASIFICINHVKCVVISATYKTISFFYIINPRLHNLVIRQRLGIISETKRITQFIDSILQFLFALFWNVKFLISF